VVGIFGEIHPELADSHKLPSGCCLFDFELEQLLTAASANELFNPVFKAYPTVPASERDLAFVVSETIEASLILSSIRKWAGSLLENVQLLDRYTGAQVDPGFCSIAVRLRFRAEDSTLRDEQVEPLMLKTMELLQKTFNAKLRV
jgi:phenylalanyl-tRNA synthetase beta chain